MSLVIGVVGIIVGSLGTWGVYAMQEAATAPAPTISTQSFDGFKYPGGHADAQRIVNLGRTSTTLTFAASAGVTEWAVINPNDGTVVHDMDIVIPGGESRWVVYESPALGSAPLQALGGATIERSGTLTGQDRISVRAIESLCALGPSSCHPPTA